MIWGYSGVWMGEFLTLDKDPHLAALKRVAERGFRCTDVFLDELEAMEPEKRERVFAFLEEHDLFYALRPQFNLWGPDFSRDQLKREVETQIRLLEHYAKPSRCRLVGFNSLGNHRFSHDPELPAQLERLAEALAPLAGAAHALGIPFGVENHGDYYCADLAELCRNVPHLGIFLDTGNVFLIGEQPLPAFEVAAPHVVGGHFKDHFIQPDPHTLCLRITGAISGQGEARLRECYEILQTRSPDPDRIVMQIEWIPCPGHDHMEALTASMDWVRRLENR